VPGVCLHFNKRQLGSCPIYFLPQPIGCAFLECLEWIYNQHFVRHQTNQ
jgi:hypothetical protein